MVGVFYGVLLSVVSAITTVSDDVDSSDSSGVKALPNSSRRGTSPPPTSPRKSLPALEEKLIKNSVVGQSAFTRVLPVKKTDTDHTSQVVDSLSDVRAAPQALPPHPVSLPIVDDEKAQVPMPLAKNEAHEKAKENMIANRIIGKGAFTAVVPAKKADAERIVSADSSYAASPCPTPAPMTDEQVSVSKPLVEYQVKKVIVERDWGAVCLVEVIGTGETVVAKNRLVDPRYETNEVEIMQMIKKHSNVVQPRHMFYQSVREHERHFYIITDLYSCNFTGVIDQYRLKKELMPPLLVKIYAYQLCNALHHIHSLDICHGDITPYNMLVDTDTMRLRLCGFGSAKVLVPGEKNKVPRFYRPYAAPEVINRASEHTCSVDIWSMACVVAETIFDELLFDGQNLDDHFIQIVNFLGTPSEKELKAIEYPSYPSSLPVVEPISWSTLSEAFKVSAEAIDFLAKCLVYRPNRRMTAKEAPRHDFFQELHEANAKFAACGWASWREFFEWIQARKEHGDECIQAANPTKRGSDADALE